MGKKAGDAAATTDTKNQDPPKQDPPASNDPPKTDDDAAGAGDAGAKDTKKPEKSFTKAELDTAAKKAVDDAKKKWDDEKDLTELERLKKENQELGESIRLRDAREEVVTALQAAGANSPALAFEAIKGSLKFDDAGKLVNSKDLIDGLKTSYPEQFGPEKPADGIDAGAGQGKAGEKLTKEKLAAMSPADINALDWKDVAAVMAEK